MKTTANACARRGAILRRSAAALLVGVSLAAAAAHDARAAAGGEGAVPSPDHAPLVDPRPSQEPPAAAPVADDHGAAPAPAAAPAAEPAPVVAAPIADPLGAAIVALLADQGPATRLKMPAADRAALTGFYAGRQGAPVWLSQGRFSAKADAARARIAAADDDGLDARRYKLPSQPATDDPAMAARAEIEFSLGALAYAREAWGGRVAPEMISTEISAKADPFDAPAALAALDGAGDVAGVLDGFNPQHSQFLALRAQLRDVRAGAAGGGEDHPVIAGGKLLQPGDEDPRVPALRKRLGVSGDADDFYYDSVLSDAVIAFQKEARIGASGLVNRQTVRALNGVAVTGGAKGDAGMIEANMERWRWMPRDLGRKHVFVDLAAFKLHIRENDRTTYETRVIIGKATNQTPLLSSAISQIVVNPYWNVPVSIAMNEMMNGSLRGFEVVDNRGRKVESFSWEDVKANRLRIRQPPGERNALGHIKFLFPNRHAVYLHDTSSRSLFARDDRALSHGCVRVDKPLEFADALSGDQGWSGDRLKAMIGGKERAVPLASTIPVHLTYFTAWVDDGGRMETRKDIYGLDERVILALKGQPLPPLRAAPITPRIAQAKPKPNPAEAATAVQALPPAPRREGPAAWLARIFGDSRY